MTSRIGLSQSSSPSSTKRPAAAVASAWSTSRSRAACPHRPLPPTGCRAGRRPRTGRPCPHARHGPRRGPRRASRTASWRSPAARRHLPGRSLPSRQLPLSLKARPVQEVGSHFVSAADARDKGREEEQPSDAGAQGGGRNAASTGPDQALPSCRGRSGRARGQTGARRRVGASPPSERASGRPACRDAPCGPAQGDPWPRAPPSPPSRRDAVGGPPGGQVEDPDDGVPQGARVERADDAPAAPFMAGGPAWRSTATWWRPWAWSAAGARRRLPPSVRRRPAGEGGGVGGHRRAPGTPRTRTSCRPSRAGLDHSNIVYRCPCLKGRNHRPRYQSQTTLSPN